MSNDYYQDIAAEAKDPCDFPPKVVDFGIPLTDAELCKIRDRFRSYDLVHASASWSVIMDSKDFLAMRRATPCFHPWQLRMLLGLDRKVGVQ